MRRELAQLLPLETLVAFQRHVQGMGGVDVDQASKTDDTRIERESV